MSGLRVSAHGLVHIYRSEANDVVALTGVAAACDAELRLQDGSGYWLRDDRR